MHPPIARKSALENAEENVVNGGDGLVDAPVGDGASAGDVAGLTAEQEAELDVLEARILNLIE
ncbi:hypothetical protein [Kitasatospora camelliae]|uniref:Uncharacterized protein n=1 Tax=Kitasatospora camelliae TaxID=3156397 RepID=A0AAU8KAE8_9ACTN